MKCSVEDEKPFIWQRSSTSDSKGHLPLGLLTIRSAYSAGGNDPSETVMEPVPRNVKSRHLGRRSVPWLRNPPPPQSLTMSNWTEDCVIRSSICPWRVRAESKRRALLGCWFPPTVCPRHSRSMQVVVAIRSVRAMRQPQLHCHKRKCATHLRTEPHPQNQHDRPMKLLSTR